MAAALQPGAGIPIWQAIAAGEPPGAPPDRAALDRFAELASPALADHLLGGGVLDAGAVHQSRLNNRFRMAGQRECLAEIGRAGIEVVAIKGYALAHTLYDPPEVRAVGDIDILVRASDRDRLLAHLLDRGYVFEPLPRPPWGFISEASYAPFVSPDGVCNLDVHIHPDCFPAYRSLTTDLVFAAARTLEGSGGVTFRAASPSHAFLLCATNVAKDKFGPFAARKLADAMRLARTGTIEWDRLDTLAGEGGYAIPYRIFLRLLVDLGLDASHLPDAARAPVPARLAREYARMRDDTLALYPREYGLLATLRRELLLSTEPAVGLRNAWSRIRGLARRDDGVPEIGRAAGV